MSRGRKLIGARGAAAIALGVALAVNGAVAAQAAPGTCQIRNQDTHTRYSDISTAVTQAGEGHTLQIRGICPGHDIIVDKTLTLEGKPAKPHKHRATIDAQGLGRVLDVTDTGDLTISGGLAITGGDTSVYQDPDWYAPHGGGIRSLGGAVSLRDHGAILDNRASGYGAGIYSFAGDLAITGYVAVEGNASEHAGGGIYNRLGTIHAEGQPRIMGNTAGMGGGIYSTDGAVILGGSAAVSGNKATEVSVNIIHLGGGVYNDLGTLTLTDSATIGGNMSDGHGGGVFNRDSGTVTLTGNATIAANSAGVGYRGGGIWNSGGVLAGVFPGIGGNVYDNTPDDVYQP